VKVFTFFILLSNLYIMTAYLANETYFKVVSFLMAIFFLIASCLYKNLKVET
jgi:hypothetical protein